MELIDCPNLLGVVLAHLVTLPPKPGSVRMNVLSPKKIKTS